MFYWEVLSGASWDGHKSWIEVPLWGFNDSIGHLLWSALLMCNPGHVTIRAKWRRWFCFYLHSQSPLHLVRVLQLGLLEDFSIPLKMKEICQNGNLENYTRSCEIRQICAKFAFQSIHGIYNNALFCGRTFFFFSWLCKEHVCRTGQAWGEYSSLLTVSKPEGQIGSIPGAGGHTYLWKWNRFL